MNLRNASDCRLPQIIPRKELFSSPEKWKPKMSPDGKSLSYLASINNTVHILIKTMGEEAEGLLQRETCLRYKL